MRSRAQGEMRRSRTGSGLLVLLIAVTSAMLGAAPAADAGQAGRLQTDPTADVAIGVTATDGFGFVRPIVFTITVTNNGPDAVQQVVARAALFIPDDMAPSSNQFCRYNAWAEYCTTGTLQPGASVQLTFDAAKTLGARGPRTVTVTRYSSTPRDPNPANDSASVVVCASYLC